MNFEFPFTYGQYENIVWFFIIVGAGVVAVAVPALIQARRLRRLADENRSENVKRHMEELDLDVAEGVIFRAMLHSSPDPPMRLLRSVESFDRGVDLLLEDSRRLSSVQRVDLLRTIRGLRRKLGFDQLGPHEIMQSTRTLPVGQEVTFALPGDRGSEDVVTATVLQVDDEGITLRIDPRRAELRDQLLAAETAELEIHFFRSDDCAYAFRSPVLRTRHRGPGVLRVGHPAKLFRQQRRSSLRVDIEERIEFRWFPAALSRRPIGLRGELQQVLELHRGTVTNLSGGGMQLRVKDLEVSVDDWIETRLPFLPPPLDREFCLARVVQVYERPPVGLFGLQFEKPPVRLETGIFREVERRHRALLVRESAETPPVTA